MLFLMQLLVAVFLVYQHRDGTANSWWGPTAGSMLDPEAAAALARARWVTNLALTTTHLTRRIAFGIPAQY